MKKTATTRRRPESIAVVLVIDPTRAVSLSRLNNAEATCDAIDGMVERLLPCGSHGYSYRVMPATLDVTKALLSVVSA